MLPRKNRLKGARIFDEIKKQGEMHQSENFGLLVRERKDSEETRVGFIVSNKISKKATDRNKIKRMLRKAVGKNFDEIEKGYDLLFLARKGLIDFNKEGLEKEVEKALGEANLI